MKTKFDRVPSDQKTTNGLVVFVYGTVQQSLFAPAGTSAPHVRVTTMTHLQSERSIQSSFRHQECLDL